MSESSVIKAVDCCLVIRVEHASEVWSMVSAAGWLCGERARYMVNELG